MKKLAILASTAVLAALSLVGNASAHAGSVSPTGWGCYGPGSIYPYAVNYYLYCGTDYKYYLVHTPH